MRCVIYQHLNIGSILTLIRRPEPEQQAKKQILTSHFDNFGYNYSNTLNPHKTRMYKLNDLPTIQNPRRSRSDQAFRAGMASLSQAHEQRFRDPVAAQAACSSFIEAIRLYRSDIRSYLMLAYIFSIYEDFNTAADYLRAAHDAAPAHPDVIHFRKQLQAMHLGQTLQNPDTRDDQEYHALEARLAARVRTLTRQPLPSVSADPAVYATLSENNQRFIDLQKRFAGEVKALSDSFDTHGLHKLLLKLGSLWFPYEQILRDSYTLMTLKAEIQQTQLKVMQLLRQSFSARATADIEGLEAELETLLDRCDAFGQTLETLNRRQVSVQEVEPVYGNLLAQVEAFRESLDESLAAFS